MFSNNGSRLSKSKKVSVSNFKGASSEDFLEEIEHPLESHQDTLVVYAGNNGLTKNVNTLRNLKRICEEIKFFPKRIVKYKDCIFKYNISQEQTEYIQAMKRY